MSSGKLSRRLIAQLYKVDRKQVRFWVIESLLTVKISIPGRFLGDVDDTDVYWRPVSWPSRSAASRSGLNGLIRTLYAISAGRFTGKEPTAMVSTPSSLKAKQVAETMALIRVGERRGTGGIVTALPTSTVSTWGSSQKLSKRNQFTTQTLGWILGAFSLGYAWFHVPGGGLADRFGARRVWLGQSSGFCVHSTNHDCSKVAPF